MSTIEMYFQTVIYPSNVMHYPACIHVIPNSVSQSLNEALVAQVTFGEVEKAFFFSLGDLKALGPNGLSAVFYQRNCDV